MLILPRRGLGWDCSRRIRTGASACKPGFVTLGRQSPIPRTHLGVAARRVAGAAASEASPLVDGDCMPDEAASSGVESAARPGATARERPDGLSPRAFLSR